VGSHFASTIANQNLVLRKELEQRQHTWDETMLSSEEFKPLALSIVQ